MRHDQPDPATDCPERQPIDPDKPSPDWFVGCWAVRVGRPAPRIKIDHRADQRLDLFIWRRGAWEAADVLAWNPRTMTLDSRLRCISYWRRSERVSGARDTIFAYLRDPDSTREVLPFERRLVEALAAKNLANTDVAWGAEEEGG